MVDAFLIVTVVVMAILILVIAGLILVKFSHPDDDNEAKFPKIVVMMGLWLCFATVLIMPYDVANSRGEGGGVDVDVMWQIVFIWLAFMLAILIPFAFFYYENDLDPDQETNNRCQTQCGYAMQYTIAFLIIFCAILFIMFALLNEANIPVTRLAQHPDLVVLHNETIPNSPGCDNGCVKSEFTWTVDITFPIYLMAMMSFFGWFFFIIFAGIGLIALPVDLINEFRTRPLPMSKQDYFQQRRKLGERAKLLIGVGRKLQSVRDRQRNRSSKQRTADESDMRRFEKYFYFLKRDKKLLDAVRDLKEQNPLIPFGKLVLGIIGFFISLSWIVHIAVFLLPEPASHPFLNDLFRALSEDVAGGNFSMFGVLAFAIWSFYMLWCVVKGNFKFGVRLVFWRIFPMEVNNTMMNSFLANIWFLLLCTLPCVQLCASAFPIYARETEIDMLFGTQARYLKFFEYFFRNNVFIISLLVAAGLTLIMLITYPNDASAKVDKELEELADDANEEMNIRLGEFGDSKA